MEKSFLTRNLDIDIDSKAIISGITKNRITLLSLAAVTAFLVKAVLLRSVEDDAFLNCALLGALLSSATFCGKTTHEIYIRTINHIDKFGSIDPRFFDTAMFKDSKEPVFGYCQLQGMYLAAKQAGIVDQFLELKKERTQNIVPNL